jgi:hypothetical protein
MQTKTAKPASATDQPSAFGPVFVAPDEAFRSLAIGRTKGWELIRDGHLVARKIGARTVVDAESIRRYAASLPRLKVPA